jgi:uncharacterized protein involved in exopolysaccharide biosynthesis
MGEPPDWVQARPLKRPQPHSVYEGPSEELFDWQKVRRYIRFTLGSVRRRRGLFLLVSCGMVGMAAAALAVLPKTYEVESRLLAQMNPVMGSQSGQMDPPTRSAAELIIRTENLHALIEQTHLLDEWFKRRAPIQRLRDWITLKLRGPPNSQELLRDLTGLLSKRLVVWTTPEGMVAIRLTWPDPLIAYRLVDAAEQNFLEKRHVLEISSISERLSILEGHAAEKKKDIVRQVDELQRRKDSGAKTALRDETRPAVPHPVDPKILKLKVMLDAKRRTIADLEEMRRRHALELQTRLTEQRSIYSENHPVVINLRESIEAVQSESPQVISLRREEASLRGELARAGGHADFATRLPTIPPDLFRSERELLGLEDPSMDYERAQLRFALQEYANLLDRISAAHIDLDTAQAGFKYRYSVVMPPEVPRGPIKPKSSLVMFASLIVALLLGLFATTAADMRGGLVLEHWQIEELVGPSTVILQIHYPQRRGTLASPGSS